MSLLIESNNVYPCVNRSCFHKNQTHFESKGFWNHEMLYCIISSSSSRLLLPYSPTPSPSSIHLMKCITDFQSHDKVTMFVDETVIFFRGIHMKKELSSYQRETAFITFRGTLLYRGKITECPSKMMSLCDNTTNVYAKCRMQKKKKHHSFFTIFCIILT